MHHPSVIYQISANRTLGVAFSLAWTALKCNQITYFAVSHRCTIIGLKSNQKHFRCHQQDKRTGLKWVGKHLKFTGAKVKPTENGSFLYKSTSEKLQETLAPFKHIIKMWCGSSFCTRREISLEIKVNIKVKLWVCLSLRCMNKYSGWWLSLWEWSNNHFLPIFFFKCILFL